MTPMKTSRSRVRFTVLAIALAGCATGMSRSADALAPAGKESAAASVESAVNPASSPSPSASPSASASPSTSPSPSLSPRDAALPSVLAEIEAEYSAARTLSARFTQTETIEALDQTKKSEGVIYIKRPDKLRWETQRPDPNLLVGNGRKFYFYTPPFDEGERGQLIEQDAGKIRSRLAHALLAGSFSVARDMKIERISPEHFKLLPSRGSAGTVREAELFVSAEKKRIVRVILQHEGGNRSDIRLSEVRLGTRLPDSLFRFVPPPGTDIMKGD